MRPLYKRTLLALVFVVAPLGYLFNFVIEPWTIPGDDLLLTTSILPQLEKGDVVFVRRTHEPRVGKTVRCADPAAAGRFLVGRLVAARHGIVQLRSEGVTVDGVHEVAVGPCETKNLTLPNPRGGDATDLTCWREPFHGATIELLYANDRRRADLEASVDEGRGFLVSDNRHFHLDSRDFGLVNLESCADIVFRLKGESGLAGKFGVVW